MIAIFIDKKGFQKSGFVHIPTPIYEIAVCDPINLMAFKSVDEIPKTTPQTLRFYLVRVDTVSKVDVAIYQEE